MKKSENLMGRLIISMSVLISGVFAMATTADFVYANNGNTETELDIDLKLKQLNECHDNTSCANNSETLIESQSENPIGEIKAAIDTEVKQKNKCHDETECENNSQDEVNAGNILQV